MAGSEARLSDLMQRRRLHLGMKTWRALALEAGVAYETLRALRAGENVTPGTTHALERALEWQAGSIDAILDGGHPTPLEADPVRQAVAAHRASREDRQMQLIREIRERAEELARMQEQGGGQASDRDEDAG